MIWHGPDRSGVGNEDPFRAAFPNSTIISCVVRLSSSHRPPPESLTKRDLGRSEPKHPWHRRPYQVRRLAGWLVSEPSDRRNSGETKTRAVRTSAGRGQHHFQGCRQYPSLAVGKGRLECCLELNHDFDYARHPILVSFLTGRTANDSKVDGRGH